jgi:hypothetical protein
MEAGGDARSSAVELVGDRPLSFTTLKLSGPPRVVVDFADTDLDASLRELVVEDGTVRRVAAASAGSRTARVVIELTADAEFDVRAHGNRVEVRVPRAAPLLASAEAPAVASQGAAAAEPGGAPGTAESPRAAGEQDAGPPAALDPRAAARHQAEERASAAVRASQQRRAAIEAQKREAKEKAIAARKARAQAAAEKKARQIAAAEQLAAARRAAAEQAAAERKARQSAAAADRKARESAAADRKARESAAAADRKARESSAADRQSRESSAADRKARESAAADRQLREQSAGDRRAVAPPPARAGVPAANPQRKLALAGQPSITGIGFRPEGGGSVIVRSDRPLEYGVDGGEGAVLLHLPGAGIPLPNNRRPLDTRFFNGPVLRVVPVQVAGGTDLRIELRGRAEYQLVQSGAVLTLTFSAPR